MIGTHVVHLGYAFSPDEFMPRLQAESSPMVRLRAPSRRSGASMAAPCTTTLPITTRQPALWRALIGRAWRRFRPLRSRWTGPLRLRLHDGWVGSADSFACANSVAGFQIGALIAALLVATSSQALAAAMTSYAMAPHLFFNLLWLRLFLLDKWWSHVAAALCGVFTASLHQIHPHLFFAAPFFLLLLRPFRPGVLLWYGAVYAVGHLAIIGWDRLAMAIRSPSPIRGS